MRTKTCLRRDWEINLGHVRETKKNVVDQQVFLRSSTHSMMNLKVFKALQNPGLVLTPNCIIGSACICFCRNHNNGDRERNRRGDKQTMWSPGLFDHFVLCLFAIVVCHDYDFNFQRLLHRRRRHSSLSTSLPPTLKHIFMFYVCVFLVFHLVATLLLNRQVELELSRKFLFRIQPGDNDQHGSMDPCHDSAVTPD